MYVLLLFPCSFNNNSKYYAILAIDYLTTTMISCDVVCMIFISIVKPPDYIMGYCNVGISTNKINLKTMIKTLCHVAHHFTFKLIDVKLLFSVPKMLNIYYKSFSVVQQ